MTTLALIGTFHQRRERTVPLLAAVLASTRPPDEVWVMCEALADADRVTLGDPRLRVCVLPTPRERVAPWGLPGGYATVPYSHKINWALERTEADYIAYLDNASEPAPGKYALMAAALDEHPDWGAVYCAQDRVEGGLAPAAEVIEDPYCVLNYTQVMHRRTPDRWSLDVRYMTPDVVDGMFFRDVARRLGPFHPVGDGAVLDRHELRLVA